MRELVKVEHLKKHRFEAKDGWIGRLEDVYFDDDRWTLRYFGLDATDWLPDRQLLVAPGVVIDVDGKTRTVRFDLRREKLAKSPPLPAGRTPTVEECAAVDRFFGWPQMTGEAQTKRTSTLVPDTEQAVGYRVRTRDGEFGHVEDFVVDDQDWIIRYLEIDTGKWWPGKKVLIAPAWIEGIDWDEGKVLVDLPRELIRNAPTYHPSRLITPEYEVELYAHYGKRR